MRHYNFRQYRYTSTVISGSAGFDVLVSLVPLLSGWNTKPDRQPFITAVAIHPVVPN